MRYFPAYATLMPASKNAGI